jgi:hypothetical protein
MAESITEIFVGLIKQNFVSKEEKETRLNICKNCPSKMYSLGQCLECDCIATLKTKYKSETCPLNHWA